MNQSVGPEWHRVRAERKPAHELFRPGLDRQLSRYFILPLRGRDVLLVKNLGLAVIVAAQLALLILAAAWQSGPVEAAAEVIEARGTCCCRIWPGATWSRSRRHSRCSSIASRQPPSR